MEAKNYAQTSAQETSHTRKFAEPRGWALKWDGPGLDGFSPSKTEEPEQMDANGARGKFAEPRGWALKWDGFGLSEQRKA
ncbi:MAG: hypothetical protein DRI79_11475 [Chloroflexi bacterium]|nr:MAG: hypothetical protein DRI80_09090 [Chloroflexota bacterium]RLC85347.1 MAG: hypothetical protein DRI79_11475 [Chloroflexota bacterium]